MSVSVISPVSSNFCIRKHARICTHAYAHIQISIISPDILAGFGNVPHAEANNVDASSSFITALHTRPGAIRNFPELLSSFGNEGEEEKEEEKNSPRR